MTPRLRFLKIFIFGKTAGNFLGISRKHVFTASNGNVIKNRTSKSGKKKLVQILSKSYSFLV